MKKRVIKIALAITLVLCMALSLVSCANTGALPEADSASGGVDGTSLTWNYDKSTKTLKINGEGAIPDFESSEKVSWYGVRQSVEKIEMSDKITSVGAYAFYYMPKLTSIELPEGTTALGKLAFAFCTSLKALSLPEALTAIGDGCFEGCASLESIYVPAAVTSVGERAFMSCFALENVLFMGQVSEIKALTFKGCDAIETLCFNSELKEITVAENAFEGASKNMAGANFTESLTGKIKVTVKYVYADGSEAAPDASVEYAFGENYSIVSPAVTGYTASKLTVSGTVTDYVAITETVTYTPDTPDTSASTDTADTEKSVEDDKIGAGTIVALVVLVVVIAGIVVVAVFMMRADKKDAKGGKGTSKNNSAKK